jgi:hypothetical protein
MMSTTNPKKTWASVIAFSPSHFHQLRFLSSVMEICCHIKGCISDLAEESIYSAKNLTYVFRA